MITSAEESLKLLKCKVFTMVYYHPHFDHVLSDTVKYMSDPE